MWDCSVVEYYKMFSNYLTSTQYWNYACIQVMCITLEELMFSFFELVWCCVHTDLKHFFFKFL